MNMLPPKDVSGIKRFGGMVTYQAKFLPHLSSICTPPGKLEKIDVAWHWEEQHEAALENIKRLNSTASSSILQPNGRIKNSM